MYLEKNDRGLWEVRFYYKDYTGKRRQKHKGGFETRREAKAYADSYVAQEGNSLNISFEAFWKIYMEDMKYRLRENTLRTKAYIVELKIIPVFGKKLISEITAADIRKWQNSLLTSGYSETYLKTINNQMSAIFNYAIKYYGLTKNPCAQAGSIGRGSTTEEMQIWTQEEFEKFVEAIKDKTQYYYAFKLLFWTGCRLGELLALTIADFDVENKTLSISKSLQRIDGVNIITDPKTPKSKRIIPLPDFLCDELVEYCGVLYGYGPSDRLFMVTKTNMEKIMRRGIEISGVKRIRLHDLRHSHASLLISKLGAQPLLVAQRLGHGACQVKCVSSFLPLVS